MKKIRIFFGWIFVICLTGVMADISEEQVLKKSSYEILEIEDDATQEQIRIQYKKLKKKYRQTKDSQKTKELDKAFQEVMLDNTLEITLPKQKKPKRNRRRRRGLPKLSDIFRTYDFKGNDKKQGRQKAPINKKKDQIYIQDEKKYKQQIQNEYGYRLPPEYDDPSFYRDVNKTERVFNQQSVNWNMKMARIILFLGGILLKLSPCLILFCIYKFRRNANPNPVGVQDVLTRAANGWTGRSRKVYKNK